MSSSVDWRFPIRTALPSGFVCSSNLFGFNVQQQEFHSFSSNGVVCKRVGMGDCSMDSLITKSLGSRQKPLEIYVVERTRRIIDARWTHHQPLETSYTNWVFSPFYNTIACPIAVRLHLQF